MAWSIINVITGPCKCGKGLLRSVHKTDGNGNFETDWSLTCPECSSKYNLVKEILVGNPDKSLSVVRYEEKAREPCTLPAGAHSVPSRPPARAAAASSDVQE